jgi:Uma2 family endonuclease
MGPARHRATYEDVLNAPEYLVAEIVDGELYTSPRPASPHANATAAMTSALRAPFNRDPGGSGEPGGWWILGEPELHFGADVIVPDLAGWRRERMPRMPNVTYFEQAPDWVCEVVSPRTGILDRRRKMPIYAREKVSHLWIVDPILKTVEVYRLESDHWVVASTHGGTDRVRAEPFQAVELDLTGWWLEP